MRILLFERFMEDKRNINPDPTYLQVINQNVCPKYIDRCLGNTNLLTLALHNVTFTNDSFILMIEQLKYNTYITALSLDQNRPY
jgi:hypothetical protein